MEVKLTKNRNDDLIKQFKIKLIKEDLSIAAFCRIKNISYETYKDFKKGKTTGEKGKGAKQLVQAIQSYLAEEDQAA